MPRCLKTVISKAALSHNFNIVRSYAPKAKILAMIKANAYGHGAVWVAETLKKADAFGVAFLEEANVLRLAGITQRIVLMEGFFHPQDIAEMAQLNLEPVLHHSNQIQWLSDFRMTSAPLRVWMKINTGMNRLGFACEEFKKYWEQLKSQTGIEVEGFMTHFSHADRVQHGKTEQQMADFETLVSTLPGEKSLANSAGILGWEASHAEWVRPGIILYGVSPLHDREGRDLGLKPVMSFESQLISIQKVKQGQTIGYEGHFECPRDMLISVVAAGYADGYPRGAPLGTPVWVGSQVVPLVGRVSMDMLTVDLSDRPQAKIGDAVELWGSHLPVERVARAMSRSPYELLTGLTARVPSFSTEDLI